MFLDVKKTYILPDPDHHYFFQYVPNGFWADDITVEFGPNGFLSRIHTQVEDQLDQVVGKALDIMTGVVQIGAGVIPDKATKRDPNAPIIVFKGTIDPFDSDHQKSINKALEAHNATFTARVLGKPQKGVETTERSPRSGIYVKPRALCEIAIDYAHGKVSRQLELPHPMLLEFIEIPVASLVKTVFEIKFDLTGYPTSIHINKPSSLVALGNLFLMPVVALIELPAKIFKVRVDIDSAKTTSIKSQASYAQSKAYYEAQMRAIEEGKVPASPGGSVVVGGGSSSNTGTVAISTSGKGSSGVPMATQGSGGTAAGQGSSSSWEKEKARLTGKLKDTEEELKHTNAKMVSERSEKARVVTAADREDDEDGGEVI